MSLSDLSCEDMPLTNSKNPFLIILIPPHTSSSIIESIQEMLQLIKQIKLVNSARHTLNLMINLILFFKLILCQAQLFMPDSMHILLRQKLFWKGRNLLERLLNREEVLYCLSTLKNACCEMLVERISGRSRHFKNPSWPFCTNLTLVLRQKRIFFLRI